MRRRNVILALVAVAFVSASWPAWAASPVSRIRALERQVRALVVKSSRSDDLQTTTVTGPISFTETYGTGSANCPLGTRVTGGGVRWVGQYGADSAVYWSEPSGAGTWRVGVRAGAGTTGAAFVVAVCARLG